MSPSHPSFDTSENFGDWVRLHGRQVAIGVGAVAVLFVGTVLWRSNQSSRSGRADAEFLQARQPLALGDQAAAERELRRVAQRYDGTAGGAQAQLLLAQVLFDQGKFQDGLIILQEASDAPKTLSNSVRVLTAAGNEGLGKFNEAGKAYEDAAAAAVTPPEKLQLQASAARAYQAGGDRTSAIRLWTELSGIDGQGAADEARVRLGELLAANGGTR